MTQQPKIPTIAEIETYLKEYGWSFRQVTGDTTSQKNAPVIIAPYSLDAKKGVLVVFHIEGEFVMANTTGLMTHIPTDKAVDLLQLNDTIKLVKLFTSEPEIEDHLSADVGFELWAESWNKETFFAFMDMFCMAIDAVLDEAAKRNIPHQTTFVTFEEREKAEEE